jgi:hypothetical protein
MGRDLNSETGRLLSRPLRSQIDPSTRLGNKSELITSNEMKRRSKMSILALAALVTQATLTFETKTESFTSSHYSLDSSYIMARETTPVAQKINQTLFTLSRPLCTPEEIESIRQAFESGTDDNPYRDQLNLRLTATHSGFIRADLERSAYCGGEEVRESREFHFDRSTGDLFSLEHELGDPSIGPNGEWLETYDSSAKTTFETWLVQLWSSGMGSGKCKPGDASGFIRILGLDSKGSLLLANHMFRPGHQCRRSVAISYRDFGAGIPQTSRLHAVLKP